MKIALNAGLAELRVPKNVLNGNIRKAQKVLHSNKDNEDLKNNNINGLYEQ